MAIKTYRPTTQTLRYRTTIVNDDITTRHPHKPLIEPKPRTGGRRNSGDMTMRFIGGGHKRKLRIIDFKRDKTGIPATVVSIEYDPNRSPRIALLAYADGEKRYILQPEGLKVGQKVISGPEADILVGNALPLRNIPPGTQIHNLELKPGKGGADGAFGGRSGAVGCEGRRVCAGEIAFGRDAKDFAGLHGDDRAGRQPRSRERHHRQGRTFALAGKASA
jgi:ribosomal protein L2